MAGVEQPCYTLINFSTDSEPYNEMQLKMDLEKGDTKKKIEALKKVIGIILSGEKIPGLLMIIIRFVLPLQDHTIKKLLLIFWEIVPKTTPDGKLMQEMILVCDAYRKDLQHPNEFIRGSTLRFLCKLKEPELLEPLMPAIRACLEHRHSYVRRNAVLAIFTIYRNFEFLIPDAPELVANFLENEQDMSCKRNAFLMLLHADQEKALNYLASRLDNVNTFGDILQLVIVELIYKVCHANPGERGRFIRTVYALLNSSSAAVRYEAAGTLTTLSTAPAAIKAAAACYIDLIVKESDNNVKLIVLDRLKDLASGAENARALGDLAMDVLRVLPASDMAARDTALQLALKLVPARQAEQLVSVLRKEAARATDTDFDQRPQYRRLLVKALGQAAIKFSEVAGSVVPALLELVGEGSDEAAGDVMLLVREALTLYPLLIDVVYEKLLFVLPGIKAGKCARSALWLLAQFADTEARANKALDLIIDTLSLNEDSQESEGAAAAPQPEAPRALVTSDGTYATQSAFTSAPSTASPDGLSGLKHALLSGEGFTAVCCCAALGKLAQRVAAAGRNRALHAAAALLAHRQRNTTHGAQQLTLDDISRASQCIQAGSSKSDVIRNSLLAAPPAALPTFAREEEESAEEDRVVDVETGVNFSQLSGALAQTQHDMFDVALLTAVSGRTKPTEITSKLSKVTQLTGFSDPVYAEAIVSVNQYDIVLDILLVNQTDDTLQNCTVELATLGELRLVERPAAGVLAPRDYLTIPAHVKVASTESGLIFGNVVYEVAGSGTSTGVVVLNDIHVDIVDYIHPATCSDHDFRRMWAEFEWENKVSVNTNMTELKDYLDHLLKNTNMKCLTPEKALSGSCGFMAANLYARSIFGEDALANVSLEKPAGNLPVLGHVRIRAKTQGMALSLGDKINMMQKAALQKSPPTTIPAA